MKFETLFKVGREMGLQEMEVFYTNTKSFSCKVFEQSVDSYSVSSTQGFSVRGIYEGKIGYTYTEDVSNYEAKTLIETIINHARYIEKEEAAIIYGGDEHYTPLNLYHDAINQVSAQDKINFLKAFERAAKAFDPRVKSVSYCSFANGESDILIENTNGLCLHEKSNHAYTYLDVLVSDGVANKSGSKFVVSTDFHLYDANALAQEIVEDALSKLGGKPMTSGTYPTVLSNEVASDLLDAMSSCFSAEVVMKKMSLLADKCDTPVAASCVTLFDNPHLENGLGSCSFDGEGVATKPKTIIESGVLKTYLHSLATAKHFKVEPTGNGMRSGYKSSIVISPSNFYFKPGELSRNSLFNFVNQGIYITEVQGLHSGLNTISGDFSLAASGYRIEDGKQSTPISNITISGNFFSLLNSIENLGNDLFFNLSGVGSPSLYLPNLTISGE